MESPQFFPDQGPSASHLKTLGELIQVRRDLLGLSLADASTSVGIPISVLSRLESGKAIRTDELFAVLHSLGLDVGVRAKDVARVALEAGRQGVGWHDVTGGLTLAVERSSVPEHELPIFSTSQLRITPPSTPEDIRRRIAEGRFAEMTPRQAGFDEDEQ
jgi:transcriptional regulator with XRE-family HTH domain